MAFSRGLVISKRQIKLLNARLFEKKWLSFKAD